MPRSFDKFEEFIKNLMKTLLFFSQSFRKIEKAIFSKSSKFKKVLDNWIVNEVVLSNLIFAIMEQVKLHVAILK